MSFSRGKLPPDDIDQPNDSSRLSSTTGAALNQTHQGECGLDQSFRGGDATNQMFATIGQYLERELAAQRPLGDSQAAARSTTGAPFGSNSGIVLDQTSSDLQQQLAAIAANIDADAEMHNLSSSFGALSIQPIPKAPQHDELKFGGVLPGDGNTNTAAGLRKLASSFASLNTTHSFQNLFLNASLLNASLQRSMGAMSASGQVADSSTVARPNFTSGLSQNTPTGVDIMDAMDATFGRGHDNLAKSIGGLGGALGTTGSLREAAVLASSLTSLVDAVRTQLTPAGSVRRIGGTGLGATMGIRHAPAAPMQPPAPSLAEALREGVDPNELHAPHRVSSSRKDPSGFGLPDTTMFGDNVTVEEFAHGFGTWFARRQRETEYPSPARGHHGIVDDDYDHDLAASMTSTIMSLASLRPMIPVEDQLAAFEKRRLELGMDIDEAITAGLAQQTLDELVAAHRAAATATSMPRRPADLIRNEPAMQLPTPIQEPILQPPASALVLAPAERQDSMTSGMALSPLSHGSETPSPPPNSKAQPQPTLASQRERRRRPGTESVTEAPTDHVEATTHDETSTALGNKRRTVPNQITSSTGGGPGTSTAVPSQSQLDELASAQELESLRGQVRRERREVAHKRRERKKALGCSCKRSKCLKRYCECFAQGKFCSPHCQCTDDCINTNTPENVAVLEQHRESSRRRHGETEVRQVKAVGGVVAAQAVTCNCVRSNCQKNYCLCYQSGMQCVAACKCVDCLNNKDEALTVVAATTVQQAPAVPARGHPDHPNFRGAAAGGSQGSMWSSIGSSGDFSSSQGTFGDESKFEGEEDEEYNEYEDGDDDEDDDDHDMQAHPHHHQLHHHPTAEDGEYDDDFEEE